MGEDLIEPTSQVKTQEPCVWFLLRSKSSMQCSFLYCSIVSSFRDNFYQFGEIRSVTMVARQNCAFVTFTSRPAAETAAEVLYNKLIIKGRRLKILWGKSQADKPKANNDSGVKLTPVPGLPGRKFSIDCRFEFLQHCLW